MEALKALQEQRLTLANRIQAHADKQASWNAEDRETWKTINADYDKVYEQIQAENTRQADATAVSDRLASIKSQGGNNRIGRDGGSLTDGPSNSSYFGDAGGAKEKQFNLALQAWMLAGSPDERAPQITDEHQRAAQAMGVRLDGKTGFTIRLNRNYNAVRNSINQRRFSNSLNSHIPSEGGYLYGETFVDNLEVAMKAYGGMFEMSEVIRTTNGEPMRWPTANDTSNTGRQLGETASVGENGSNGGGANDPAFAQVMWNAYKFTSDEILVPFELLREGSEINLAGTISELLGIRLGRIQNTKYTLGSGNATAKGIVTAAPTGLTTASPAAIAFDEVISLEHTIDPSRRNLPGVGYMFHDQVLLALRKLKDGVGQYLWQTGANTGVPDKLNARPFVINQDMASTITNSAVTMLYGQLTQYKIRQVNGIRMYRLVERYREQDMDAFLAFIEGDGSLLDAGDHPVKALVQHS